MSHPFLCPRMLKSQRLLRRKPAKKKEKKRKTKRMRKKRMMDWRMTSLAWSPKIVMKRRQGSTGGHRKARARADWSGTLTYLRLAHTHTHNINTQTCTDAHITSMPFEKNKQKKHILINKLI